MLLHTLYVVNEICDPILVSGVLKLEMVGEKNINNYKFNSTKKYTASNMLLALF